MIEEYSLAHPIGKEVLGYTIGEAVKYGTFSMYLPYQWAPRGDGLYGETPKDPLTIYACLDVTDGSDCVTAKTTMRDLLLDTYDLVKNTVRRVCRELMEQGLIRMVKFKRTNFYRGG